MAKDYSAIDGIVKVAISDMHIAYDRGYKQGVKDMNATKDKDNNYWFEMGLNAAWECAKKIVLPSDCYDCGLYHKIEEIFGTHDYLARSIFTDFSVSEVMARIKDYEDNQKLCSTCNNTDCQVLTKYRVTDSCIHYKPKQADDEIKVGDEVYIVMKNYPSVVTCIFSESGLENPKAIHITGSGKYAVTPLNQLHKTGRHFDTIVEVLQQLKGE